MTWFQKPPLGIPLDWEHPFNKGLALHLAMNEGHGDIVRDLSMNGNHGTLENMAFPSTVASGWNPGRTGVGMNFDGTDDLVLVTNFNESIHNEGTWSSWTKFDNWNQSGYQFIFNGEVGANVNELKFGMSAGELQFLYRLTTSEELILNYDASTLTGFHFLTFTWIGNGALGLYVDGVKVDSDTASFSMSATPSSLYTGTDAGGGYPFKGSIDQVRIHNRALPAKEVKDYYINPWQVYLDE